MQDILDAVLAAVEPHRGEGRVADYIPALAGVDPNRFGIAVAGADGIVHGAGDCDTAFSTQSISKVFTLALALEQVGADLWDKVGREPSGTTFNSIVQLEREAGKPRNPLINAGAIAVTDQLVGSRTAAAAIDELLDFLRARAGDAGIDVDEDVAASEASTGSRNRSLNLPSSH